MRQTLINRRGVARHYLTREESFNRLEQAALCDWKLNMATDDENPPRHALFRSA